MDIIKGLKTNNTNTILVKSYKGEVFVERIVNIPEDDSTLKKTFEGYIHN